MKTRPVSALLALCAIASCTGTPEQRDAKLDAAIGLVKDELKAWEPFMGASERAYVKIATDALAHIEAGTELDWKLVFTTLESAAPAVQQSLVQRGMKPEEAQLRISAVRSLLRAVQLIVA